MKNKKINPNITELFMAKAGNDYTRCFHGIIRRNVNEHNEPVISGKIKVYDGYIYSQANTQNNLGEKLDELVLLVLDNDIHKPSGIYSLVSGNKLFYN